MKMARIQKELTACLQCGYCINVCEAHSQTPWESVTPRGKIYYLNQLSNADGLDKLLSREVSLNPYFVDAMYKCTGCGNCEVVCHANIPLVEFWETVRKWIVDQGAGPMSAHKGMAKKVAECHNPYGEDHSKRGDWWPKDVKKSDTPDAIFFAGCTGSYRQQKVPQIGVRVLDRANVKMNILGEKEWCCSSPLLRTGTHVSSLECAEKVVEGADGVGAKDMVMTCSGCYKTVSSDFGKFYARSGQNVYHFAQYVEKLINEKKLPLNNEYKAKVTYHDPCHLGRHMGVFDAPRNVLKKIKGIELVEMDKSRENSRCCGAGGGYKSQYNEFAVNIAAERVRDAEETGAEILVTCCPFCVVNLTQGAKQINSKVKIMDLSEILLEVTAPVAEVPAGEKDEKTSLKATTDAAPKQQFTEKAPAVEPKPKVEKDIPAPKEETAPKQQFTEKPPAVEPKVEVKAPAQKKESTPKAEPKPKEKVEVQAEEEESGDDVWTDNSPEALVRRAAWNKGLRCRKDYGVYGIPIAFVKPKVAVYIFEKGAVDPEEKKTLEDEGWIVLSFLIKDIVDGEAQAVDIKAAVKENLKASRKKKK